MRDVPDDAALLEGLGRLFGPGFRLLKRDANPYASTFASERVVVEVEGEMQALFCKYSGGYTPEDGHHGGVAYEATVYRSLQECGVDVPHLYGCVRTSSKEVCSSEEVWLVLEAVDGERLNKAPSGALVEATRWLTNFHARTHRTEPPPYLTRYDADYYQGWAERSAHLAAPLDAYPWLEGLCERFSEEVSLLQDTPTLIHGEFYPHNILYQHERVLPIDWESAAWGAGEIDLACLTDAWPEETVEACEAAYCLTRWPEGVPEAFERRLSLAQLYLHFRWLGDRAEWTHHPEHAWRFEALHRIAQGLGWR